jgi:hypothetical protein
MFIRDAQSERPLNPLGKIDEGLEVFEATKAGDVVRLAQQAP